MRKAILEKLNILFANLCCSQCKSGFNEESMDIKRMEKEFLVVQLCCPNCGKSFGICFVGLAGLEVKTQPADVQEGPEPINCDDVIDAHKFIQNFDEHWQDYMAKHNNQSNNQ